MDFLTTNTIKSWLKISGTDDDTVIGLIGEAAEQRIEQYLNRTLKAAARTDELLSGTGHTRLAPKHFPVTTITTLKIYDGLDVDGNEVWDTWVQNTDYDRLNISPDGSTIVIDGATFPKGELNIKLSYTAGYADVTALPGDIYRAMFDLCYLYYHAIRAEKNLGKLSDIQISGGGLNTTLNFDIEAENRILKTIYSYRKVNV